MALREEMESSGSWLFRWRSYPPVIVLLLSMAALRDFRYNPELGALGTGWEMICLAVSLAGLGLRSYTIGYAGKGTSGRNVTRQVAKSLNTNGIYSAVRHPLYLGNFLIWFGVAMFTRSWWFCLMVSLVFWLYYERIMLAEEAFLRGKFGDEFMQWADATPAFIPRFTNWRRPEGGFDLRTVLKREQSGLLGIVSAFMLLDFAGDYMMTGRPALDPLWLGIFLAGFVVFSVLTAMKKLKVL